MPSTSKWPVVQMSDMGLPPAFPAKCRSTFTLVPQAPLRRRTVLCRMDRRGGLAEVHWHHWGEIN